MKPRTQRLLLSAGTQFIIAGGGAFLVAVTAESDISLKSAVVALMTGLVAAGKDARTYIADLPRDAGTPRPWQQNSDSWPMASRRAERRDKPRPEADQAP